MRKILLATIAFMTTLFFISACESPSVGDRVQSLAPPSFGWGESRVRYATTNPSLFELRIEMREYNELYDISRIELDIVMADRGEPTHRYDEARERHRLINPVKAYDENNPTYDRTENGKRYFEIDLGRYNNEFLQAEVAMYRWVATMKLKNGTDELQIESGLYIATDKPFNEREAVVNGGTGDATPPIDTSKWYADGGIFSKNAPKP